MPGILLNNIMQRDWIPAIASTSGVFVTPGVFLIGFSNGEAGLKTTFVAQTFLSVFVNRQ